MQKIVDGLRQFQPEHLSYDYLGKFVKNISLSDCQYKDLLPPVDESGSYSRNILMLEPLECVLLHWPPGVESAIHYHKGFWGYVLVLEGACDNIEYTLEDGKLIESQTIRALAGGVLDEPDGTIHKITNPSKTRTLVTAHFYYPALETLDGLAVYDIETERVGVLNEKAGSASFTEPEAHFHSIQESAFQYVPLEKSGRVRTHHIFPIIPKPDGDWIRNMISDYYNEQSKEYDNFDLLHESRRKYTRRVNQVIADILGEKGKLKEVLAIACGTGRRAIKIRELCCRDYAITCVDLSEEMCCQAEERGVATRVGAWLDVKVPDETYDAVTFLYAFGHIPSREERKASLEKIFRKMNSGGVLFLDAFNANDRNEWGPRAIQKYEKLRLANYGYEKGDVFYKKLGGEAIAFLHYFEEEDLRMLVEEAGFRIREVKHIGYVYRSGEILDRVDEGALLLIAEKAGSR
jgi:ubiquinone/menaquinone biosynthesis C-methylase UbiE